MLFACSGLPSRRRVMRITDDMFVHHLTVGDPRHIREVWSSLRFLPVSDSVWAMVQVRPRSITRPSLEARILDYCQRSGWTVTELSKSLSAPESTILTILRAYEQEGHVRVSSQGVWTVVKTKKTSRRSPQVCNSSGKTTEPIAKSSSRMNTTISANGWQVYATSQFCL